MRELLNGLRRKKVQSQARLNEPDRVSKKVFKILNVLRIKNRVLLFILWLQIKGPPIVPIDRTAELGYFIYSIFSGK